MALELWRGRGRQHAFEISRRVFLPALLVLTWHSLALPLVACPFCTAVAPSLCQRRAAADVVLLAEVLKASPDASHFRIHRIIKGEEQLESRDELVAAVDSKLTVGQLVILFGSQQEAARTWAATIANEMVAGYFLAAPSLREPAQNRLPYFARYLEHTDATIAEDAYLEFAHAPFDVVAKVADNVSSHSLRTWLKSPGVPETRKGLYGLLLGLTRLPEQRRENARFLRQEIDREVNDFRAGFDGLLGGYLLLAGPDGLKHLEARYLANPKAAVGDVRHAMASLRFYFEHGKEIAKRDLAAALAKVLARPEFAEAAIIDLARWQAWEYEREIAALYQQPGYDTSEIRRAVVGYLRTCPDRSAVDALASIRAADPQGVAAAEEVLSKYGALQSR